LLYSPLAVAAVTVETHTTDAVVTMDGAVLAVPETK
jgi:hypothetical protein